MILTRVILLEPEDAENVVFFLKSVDFVCNGPDDDPPSKPVLLFKALRARLEVGDRLALGDVTSVRRIYEVVLTTLVPSPEVAPSLSPGADVLVAHVVPIKDLRAFHWIKR